MASKKSIIDTSHSKVSFSIKKLGFITIKGAVSDIQGDIVFNENDLESSYFKVSVSTVTIDTGNTKRDEHLKSNDFFYVKEFPIISFQSTSIKKENDHFIAVGELTMLNKTQEIRIPFISQNGALIGNFKINRLDYELGKKFPTYIVGKTVQINIHAIIS